MHARLLKTYPKVFAFRGDQGATAVEYGLMVALIAIVVIVSVTLLGTNLSTIFQSAAVLF